MLDPNACKALLTNFAISKWACKIDKLIFFNKLKLLLAVVYVAQIVSNNDQCKNLV